LVNRVVLLRLIWRSSEGSRDDRPLSGYDTPPNSGYPYTTSLDATRAHSGSAKRIANARAKVRRHAWSQLPDGLPASQAVGSNLGDVVMRDVDATIVVGHSEKESSAATVKASSRFIRSGCGATTPAKLLAAQLRPGNAGANTAADHSEVLLRRSPSSLGRIALGSRSARWCRRLPCAAELAHRRELSVPVEK